MMQGKYKIFNNEFNKRKKLTCLFLIEKINILH